MSLSSNNVGKEVIYNRSVDNIEDYVKGTIVGCYIGENEEYYITSIESSGECIKVYDDSLIEIISSGGGGGSSTDSNAVHYTADSNKTDEEKAQARTNIGALGQDDLGTVLTFKGSKDTYADLLLVQDQEVGDVWFVDGEMAFFVWVEDEANPNGFWDEFGQPIDLSVYELKPTNVTDLSSTSITIASASNNKIYEYGTLSSLTVTDIDATGDFIIRFTSGSTATTTSFPAGMKFPEAFAAETNMRYEINCSNGYALVTGWPTT